VAAPGIETPSRLFQSFFIAGFECSSQIRRDGRRMDMLKSTEHNIRAADDYRLMARHGMHTVRDGVRWHLIEATRGRYDFSSFLPMLRAARDTGTQVIWDLMHYGWPAHLDIWKPEFVDCFASFASAVAKLVKDETDTVPFYTPINEISFWAWGGGDVEYLNPFAKGRGAELKRILVRAALAATDAIRAVGPARLVAAEPLIYIFPKSESEGDVAEARAYNEVQFEAIDLLSGRLEPELGGRPEYLDIIGVNYYYNNQWVDHGRTVYLGDGMYRPLHELLKWVYERYERRPLFIAETGTEASGRAPWLHYIGDEVAQALEHGVHVEGICLYPILNHPGWVDDRYCPNGLFCGMETGGRRSVYRPLAAELLRQQKLFERPELRHR
jgi:beta-glucosidase/6-phospho-beta-glucosidase/beta-galactosidase